MLKNPRKLHTGKFLFFGIGSILHGYRYLILSTRELHEYVCRFSNVLRKRGVVKGDRVAIYLPVGLQGVAAMLACARIGAIHSVIFTGFSAQALAHRIDDAQCKILLAQGFLLAAFSRFINRF